MSDSKGSKMAKILVILTGGTIGSFVEGSVINVDERASSAIVKRYQDSHGENHDFEVIQPLNVLSENMIPSDWEVLKNSIEEGLEKDYDGIIVTHGSDTLTYTSSFFGMAFSDVDIPIIFVAANYPLTDERSNGNANFASAVTFIDEAVASGVFVIYQNNKGENDVYLSTRIQESEPFYDQYTSFDGEVFGWVRENTFVYNEKCPVKIQQLNAVEKGKSTVCIPGFQYSKKVLLIKTYLGIDFSHYKLDESVGAVLIYMYHSATAPAREESGLINFLRECKQKGIPVYGASFKGEDIPLYDSNYQLVQEGLIPLCNISVEAAYGKVLLHINQPVDKAENCIEKSRFFERN